MKRDAWAGITVGLVLVPQAIAYATLAGMPPYTGLYAALLPALVGMLWGSSSLLAVGPVALTSLLVFGSLSPLATPGTPEWVTLAIWLAIYSGLFQFLLGAFRLGRIASLVSQPVIIGFTNAAAIIIILSQLPALIGLPGKLLSHPGELIERVLATPPATFAVTSAFGAAALLALIFFKRRYPRFPGMLFVAVLAIAASWALDYASYGGAIVGAIPAGLPRLDLPAAIGFDRHRDLWPAAIIVALISFTEAMSSCRVLARKQRERWDENQELIGQGLAKIASGFSGAFPVSGSFSRSALNLYAGAASAWSTLFATLCVLVSLLFLTGLIHYLPHAVLAAMIMVPVFGLLNFAAIRRLFSVSRDDGVVAVVTFAVTLFSAPRLHWGVFAGTALAMTSFLYRRMNPRIVEVALHADGTLRDRNRFDLPALAPDLLAVRMDSALNFVTASNLERFITDRCRANPAIRRVLFCAGSVNDIDATGVDTLESMHAGLRSDGVELYLSSVKKQVREVLDRAGMTSRLEPGHLFATDREAVLALRHHDDVVGL